MTEKNHMHDDAQAVQVTDAMIEAGARAMAAADGWHRWQAYATMAKHCLIAAQPLSAVAQACAVRLEARPADSSKEWTEIFPAQLEWVAKEGHQVRAIELAAKPPAAPVETGVSYEAMDAALKMGRPGIERMVEAIAKETGERIERHNGSSAESEPAAWQYFGGGEWHTFAKPTKEVLEFWTKPELEGGMGSKVRPLFTREPQTLSNREDKQ